MQRWRAGAWRLGGTSRECGRRPCGDAPGTPVLRACGQRTEKPASRQRPYPRGERAPASLAARAYHAPGAHLRTHPGHRAREQPEERERQSNGRGRVQPPRQHLPGTDGARRPALGAAEAAHGYHSRLRGVSPFQRPEHLPLTQPMPMQPQGTSDGPAGRSALRTAGRTHRFHRGHCLGPGLDSSLTSDDSSGAPRNSRHSLLAGHWWAGVSPHPSHRLLVAGTLQLRQQLHAAPRPLHGASADLNDGDSQESGSLMVNASARYRSPSPSRFNNRPVSLNHRAQQQSSTTPRCIPARRRSRPWRSSAGASSSTSCRRIVPKAIALSGCGSTCTPTSLATTAAAPWTGSWPECMPTSLLATPSAPPVHPCAEPTSGAPPEVVRESRSLV